MDSLHSEWCEEILQIPFVQLSSCWTMHHLLNLAVPPILQITEGTVLWPIVIIFRMGDQHNNRRSTSFSSTILWRYIFQCVFLPRSTRRQIATEERCCCLTAAESGGVDVIGIGNESEVERITGRTPSVSSCCCFIHFYQIDNDA